MKWYGSLYVVAMAVFLAVPLALLSHVPTAAPTVFEFVRDLLGYFLLGDVASYAWHRIEHRNRWYMEHVHVYHHVDTPPLTIWTAMVVIHWRVFPFSRASICTEFFSRSTR